jgi:hypothetical protein
MVALSGELARTRLRRARRFAAGVIVCFAAGCSGSTSPGNFDLTLHRAQWEAQHITNYQYDYLLTGYFIGYAGRPIRIVVRDGVVQSAVYIADGEPVPLPTSEWPTIDRLFDRAAKANTEGALTGIRYDSQYDFPSQIDISGPPDASGSLYASNLQPAQ